MGGGTISWALVSKYITVRRKNNVLAAIF